MSARKYDVKLAAELVAEGCTDTEIGRRFGYKHPAHSLWRARQADPELDAAMDKAREERKRRLVHVDEDTVMNLRETKLLTAREMKKRAEREVDELSTGDLTKLHSTADASLPTKVDVRVSDAQPSIVPASEYKEPVTKPASDSDE